MKINLEDLLAYYDKSGGLVSCQDTDHLPEDINSKDILTRQMVQDTDAVYFDDTTGVRIY